jgi:hypothetical protein
MRRDEEGRDTDEHRRECRVTKNVLLGTEFSARARSQKCLQERGLRRENRCGIPLAGASSAENETSSVFCDAKSPSGLRLLDLGGVGFLVQRGAEKQ